MERQLKSAMQRRRGDEKVHSFANRGFVTRLFPDASYGFIKSVDGEDVYFHAHSVLHRDFARLTVGTQVRYEVETGEHGPQATSVQIVDKPGVATDKADAPELRAPAGWEREDRR
jgi:cold shock CspA family protein